MAKQFMLGKNERLKSRKLIGQLFREGKSFYVQPFKINYLIMDKMPANQYASNVQFTVSVSSKNFKKAIDRNRIKRLTREAYRLQKKELQERLTEKKLWLAIFFIYTEHEIVDFNVIKIKVDVALKKILQLFNLSNHAKTGSENM